MYVDHHLDRIGREHLEHTHARRLRQCVRVPAQEERAVDPVRPTVEADRLGDREDVGLVERGLER